MQDIKVREQVLRARLAELDGRLHRIEDHLEQTPDPDWEEHATESEMDEVLEGLGLAGANEMDLIHMALTRIKNGTYGICVGCGKDISQERLDAVPYTASCRICAAKADRR
ncbi:MAG: TraR/DksA family transcriptional regulator [Hyphomicrobiaceae bacterium]